MCVPESNRTRKLIGKQTSCGYYILPQCDRIIEIGCSTNTYGRKNGMVTLLLRPFRDAYPTGKSTEIALHFLVFRIEKTLHRKERIFGYSRSVRSYIIRLHRKDDLR